MTEPTDPTNTPRTTATGVDRRRLVTGVASVAAAAPLLAACGSDGGSDGGSATSGSGGGAPPPPPSGTSLGSVSQVPVGGGQVFPDQKVVVTQPSQGVWKGFSAVCTHAGCLVNQVADGTITCPCHLSKFSVSDGSVQSGPAPKPLPPVEIDVKGGEASVV